MDSESPPPQRRRSARERQQRRRERQGHVARPITGRGAPRQIRPAGGWRLPKIILPQNRPAIYAIGGAVFLIAVIVVLGLLRNRAPGIDPNALWVGTEWTYEARSEDDVQALAERLREHRIGTLYAWVSVLKPDDTWAGVTGTDEFEEVREQVRAFVEQFKRVDPEANLYGWVRVPPNTLGIEPRLGDDAVRQAVADFSESVVGELGFDGVFIDVEQVGNGDADFLGVLRQVRATIGPDVPLAVAVPPDWSPLVPGIPTPPLIEPGTEWSKEYKQSVAILADQMVVTAYNSSLQSATDYSEWMAYQVEAFASAVGELDTGTQLMIGVPTYEAEPPGHDPAVENIPSALEGVKLGLEEAGDFARFVRGVAIYAEWETDETEWEQFRSAWVNN